MAASLIIEEDSGTYQARGHHPHNGYYAGDFSQVPFRELKSLTTWTTTTSRPQLTDFEELTDTQRKRGTSR